jgi:hypothetical protein
VHAEFAIITNMPADKFIRTLDSLLDKLTSFFNSKCSRNCKLKGEFLSYGQMVKNFSKLFQGVYASWKFLESYGILI